MTVFNTNYANIDDAYGFLNPKLNSKNKKNADPLCQLYDNSSNNQSDSDLVTFANQYSTKKKPSTDNTDRFNKTNYQKQNTTGREENPKVFNDIKSSTKKQVSFQEIPKMPVTPKNRGAEIYDIEEDDSIIKQ